MIPHMKAQVAFIWKNKNKFFSWKRNQNGQPKNFIFKLYQFSIFFVKISWIGPLVIRLVGHWCGSTYMVVRLSNVCSKTKCIFFVFRLFCPYVRQPHDHIGWATSMPLASINPTNRSMKFSQKNWLSWKMTFFWVDHIEFFFFKKKKCFLPHPHEN